MRDRSWVYNLGIEPSHPGLLILTIPPWVGVVSTGDSYGGSKGRNSEYCVALVIRTIDTLTQSVKRLLTDLDLDILLAWVVC